MRKSLLNLLVLLLVSCGISKENSVGELVWADEFNYEGLPDPEKWSYEHGFVRNNESQFYTKERLENAHVHNGYLEIKGIKENYINSFFGTEVNQNRNDSVAKYTSSSIHTLDKFQVKYGRIEMRAQLPKGKGVWPAFWMMGSDKPNVGWPKCGEIDVMEYVGFDENTIYGTCHYYDYSFARANKNGGKITYNFPYDGFHIYAIEWSKDNIDFYFDNIKYYTFDISVAGNDKENPFRKPYYILLNLAIGGNWGGFIDDSNLPQSYKIDYIRVYKK